MHQETFLLFACIFACILSLGGSHKSQLSCTSIQAGLAAQDNTASTISRHPDETSLFQRELVVKKGKNEIAADGQDIGPHTNQILKGNTNTSDVQTAVASAPPVSTSAPLQSLDIQPQAPKEEIKVQKEISLRFSLRQNETAAKGQDVEPQTNSTSKGKNKKKGNTAISDVKIRTVHSAAVARGAKPVVPTDPHNGTLSQQNLWLLPSSGAGVVAVWLIALILVAGLSSCCCLCITIQYSPLGVLSSPRRQPSDLVAQESEVPASMGPLPAPLDAGAGFDLKGQIQDENQRSRDSATNLTADPGGQFWFWLLMCFSLVAFLAIAAVILALSDLSQEDKSEVAFYTVAQISLTCTLTIINFLLGQFVILPLYLGMTADEVRLFYSPSAIPVQYWLDKFDQERIRKRDSLQRKIPHICFHLVYILAWTWSLNYSHLPLDGVLLQASVVRSFAIMCPMICFIGTPWLGGRFWYFCSSFSFASPRIQDGNLRWWNVCFVFVGSGWGHITILFFWMTLLAPLFSPMEHALVMQVCTLPVAIGDAMAEIVGGCFGKNFFEVRGMGDINRKSYEGVLGMFVSTLAASIFAVVYAHLCHGVSSLVCWLVIGLVTSFVAT